MTGNYSFFLQGNTACTLIILFFHQQHHMVVTQTPELHTIYPFMTSSLNADAQSFYVEQNSSEAYPKLHMH